MLYPSNCYGTDTIGGDCIQLKEVALFSLLAHEIYVTISFDEPLESTVLEWTQNF